MSSASYASASQVLPCEDHGVVHCHGWARPVSTIVPSSQQESHYLPSANEEHESMVGIARLHSERKRVVYPYIFTGFTYSCNTWQGCERPLSFSWFESEPDDLVKLIHREECSARLVCYAIVGCTRGHAMSNELYERYSVPSNRHQSRQIRCVPRVICRAREHGTR